ncbi:serine/threonine protein kinase [Actinocrinis puniceicyclus]|uniref:non-specific serine/threonine protein kinase n=1 Tax=Actinocrinis puniceicyclus TaxID=977794 RepID=A0A8J7WU31_9ACTN|nr:serine/threonine-protein kinase [Actinocrinis puniceicyclus]MBS2966164.1 serine/threonine protein kinase [Actinocrinis puniceicyclus]
MDSAIPGSMPAMPGTVVADRYRLVRPLGAGSSATVWEAADTALDRTVAVKLLHGSALADPAERERLRREARALARLAHPRVTIVFDYLEQPQADGSVQPVLVTELLQGSTLADRLRQGPLPAADAVAVCAQLADALRAAHAAGIVHRDVKPANVMLTPGGAKLLDFGIALAATDSNLTGSMAIGTPACMAPEQLTGRGAVPATDLYALGCVLYWCLTGRPPYQSSNVAQVAQGHVYAPPPPLDDPGIPAGVVDLYMRCMAKDPAQRPSADDVFNLLTHPLQNPPPLTQRTMVMPSFDVPAQPTARPAARPTAIYRGSPEGPGGSRVRLLIGALVVAAAAAGTTALVLKTGNSGGATAGPPPTSRASVAASSAAATPPSPSTQSSSPAATDSATADPNASLGDPAADPVGYVERVRGQIDAMIAQGQDTIDPNTGRDLQNSLSDLENAITAAQRNGGSRQLREVRQKISAIQQKIADDLDNGQISQDAADQLTGELQDLSDAVSGGLGN